MRTTGVWGQFRQFLGAAVLSLLLASQASASIRLNVQPQVIIADGKSTASVSVEIRDRQGQLVPDGTPVQFVTTAGSISSVAYTSAGTARAVLTSATDPASVMVTAISGSDQAFGRVQMVANMDEANVDGRVLRMNGRYVAFSEEMRFLDAMQDVSIRYRGLLVEANAAQIELNTNVLRAFGKVGLASGSKVIEGERLYLDLNTFDGYLVSTDKKIWFNGFGLNELPEAPKNVNPDFEFKELTNSTLSWIGKEAVYIPNVKVQVKGARAYVGGIKALKIPYHEARLDGGTLGDFGQYIGAGSQGLVVDLPFYVHMTPNASTAVKVRYGERTGFGYFNGRPGFTMDLDQKYGIPGKNEGLLRMSSITNPSWGMHWDHTQQFGEKTRVTTLFETPAHTDLYGQMNLAHQLPFGNATLNLTGNKMQNRTLGRTIDAGFETNPHPVLNQKLFLSVGTRYTDIGGGQFEQLQNQRVDLQPTQRGEVSLRARPANINILKGLSFSNSATTKLLWGTTSGPALAASSGFNYALPGNTLLNLGYSFDQAPLYRSAIRQAKHNLSATATTSPFKQLRASLYGTMGLDSTSRTLAGNLSWTFIPQWRLDLLHSFYQFNGLGMQDIQVGLARKIGPRELILYYSTQRQAILFEIAASNF
jgi:hypothetical protein